MVVCWGGLAANWGATVLVGLATSPGLCCWMEVAMTVGPGGLMMVTVGWPTPLTAGLTPAVSVTAGLTAL